MMKTPNQLTKFMFVFMAVLAISCSSDDDDKTKVKYRVVSENGDLVSVDYTDEANETITEPIGNDNDWSKTINVTPPFSAGFDATFVNTDNVQHTYTLEIYKNGTLTQVVPGVVAPSSNTTGSIALEITE